jgi:hypothetical protein
VYKGDERKVVTENKHLSAGRRPARHQHLDPPAAVDRATFQAERHHDLQQLRDDRA